MHRTNFIGLDGFVWFIGVVENRKDPLNLGRVQIRAFGWHTDDKSLIPTTELPWGQPLLPPNGSTTTSSIKEGQYVVGFFSDGESAQAPIIMGVLPGIPDLSPNPSKGFADPRSEIELGSSPRGPDKINYSTDGTGASIEESQAASRWPFNLNEPTTSRLYRNENINETNVGQRRKTLDKQVPTAGPEGLYWDEPYPAYNTTPPFNNVLETESGHVFELDDTPGSERIHMMHRSGSFFEMYPTGTKVEKITKNNYQIIMGDDMIHVMGHVNITVDSDVNILARGDINIIGGNDVSARVAGSINLTAGEAFNIKASSFNVDVSGKIDMLSSRFAADAGRIDLNSGVARSANIPEAPFRSDYNKPEFEEESVPVPNLDVVNLEDITPEQGEALKYTPQFGVSEANTASEQAPPTPVTLSDGVCIPIENLTVSENGLKVIKEKEGFRENAYVDPGTKGQPITIGYGFTAKALGRPVNLGDTITRAQADDDLQRIVNDFATGVKKKLKVSCVTQGQFDAMVSFAYNVGLGNFGKSDLLRFTNAGDKLAAGDSILTWTKAAGKVLPGLVTRRQQEREIYLS